MRVPEASLESLEFSSVRERLAGLCAGPPGEALARALSPLSGEGEAREAIAETAEAREVLEEAGRPALGVPEEPAGILPRLAIEGMRLSAAEILCLLGLCSAAVAAREALARAGARWPLLAARAAALPDLAEPARLIGPHIGPSGEIADSASPELRRARRQAERLAARVRKLLEGLLHRSGAETFLSDQFITERGGRHVIPVRTDAPNAPRGIVHGVSSSGATLFVEPMETIEPNNELVRAREQEAAEIERILGEWTARLADRAGDLRAAREGLARLDLAFARASLAREQRAVAPVLGSADGLAMIAARHPVLELALGRQGRPVVPVTILLEPAERALVVSGPNAGGKTVALKTLGLLAAMAHSGLHAPAERLELPPLKQILVDIGDRQSIAASLSTFSAHIVAMTGMLSDLDPPALVLLDEIGTGTDPAEGAALATALLERLMAAGALTVVTTHHGALKAWAYSTPGVAMAAVEFDEERLEPTYRLLQGVAGASSGLAIAERLGLPAEIVRAARARLSPAARETEELLGRLRELLAGAESDREEAAGLRAALERERAEGSARLREQESGLRARFERDAAAVLEEFRRASAKLLGQVTERKERLRLEKERARREGELRRRIADEMQRLGPAETGGAAPAAPGAVTPGARVLVAPFGRPGTVEEAGDGEAVVRLGAARVRVPLSDCRLVEPAGEPAGAVPLPAGVRAELVSEKEAPGEVMLVGMRVEEALERLDKFLDEAFLSGRQEVRVIHGHGSGRLRGAVREFLSGHAHVASHRPGSAAEGGNGATVAALRR